MFTRQPPVIWLLPALGLVVALGVTFARSAEPSASVIAQWGVLATVQDADALRSLEQAASGGAVSAQQVLGSVLVSGNDPAAVRLGRAWLEKAARANDHKAQFALGKLWFKGAQGLAPDHAAALPLLQAAVEAGLPSAAYYLGLIFKNGSAGTAAQPAAAARWLGMAADAGAADAQFALGQMLLTGDGIPADPRQARELFEKAAEQEHPEAALQLLMARTRGELGFQIDAQAQASQYIEAQHALKHRPMPP